MRRVWAVLPFALVGVALLLAPATAGPAWWNLVVQVVLFTLAAAIPGYLTRHVSYVDVAWLLTLGLFLASWTLFVTLTKHTGARPAEHYSLRKRPDYAKYQATTNMFFPGPVKTPRNAE